ncbi:hypothetical protein L6E12_28890 [Actinokineospora sp. PR83]|uniref:hypothetical protein n=1 Tax=Actinokineospora sp. PR83 TaxID=2884908 RepID=UPI001F48101B|nr:hypothetical protein [Actinokineospora sp. PR83]MCG8919798.1 hypothetical protein [Actinokineospora sp. PR83]
MSDRTAPAAPVVDTALRRTAFTRVPGPSTATLDTAIVLVAPRALPASLDEDVDRLLGELW